ncbi:cytochrome c biogenesis protein/redoxin [Clostridium tunisiense]|uniref:cytochrome c biogenesis protein/redoxin n=1 Tax=Clostridium tunisiense TaxID=219748 RepID=UPI00031C3F37|nr:cytochrome c biogenesis protein/redoxin [Clostridium tunisiense]
MEFSKLLLVFVEGLLSFLSPCIVPILPVYISILSNSSEMDFEGKKLSFVRTSLFKNTVLFILGISSTFFILGASINALSQFFLSNKEDIIRIGGIIIILMGLFYMGYLNIPFLQREKRFSMNTNNMNPVTAYVLGLTFSFGWTPCVGPMLASVLIMASGAKSALAGNLMILVYALGFTMPFIIFAAFYKTMIKYLNKIKKYMNEIKKVGGVILIISGIIMVLGGADKVRGYMYEMFSNPSKVVENQAQVDESQSTSEEGKENAQNSNEDKNSSINTENSTQDISEEGKVSDEEVKDPLIAPDFKLKDQYGNTHSLSDYKGKVIFLNFWATWCPPCREEMPNIEEIYKKYNNNKDEIVILGVAMPNIGREGSVASIKKFLKEEGYSFPVVFDEDGKLSSDYFINAFPTTYIIGKDGRIVNYIPGAMDKDVMEAVIKEGLQ